MMTRHRGGSPGGDGAARGSNKQPYGENIKRRGAGYSDTDVTVKLSNHRESLNDVTRTESRTEGRSRIPGQLDSPGPGPGAGVTPPDRRGGPGRSDARL
eukprot:619504-Hanusia_phi.AAC.1